MSTLRPKTTPTPPGLRQLLLPLSDDALPGPPPLPLLSSLPPHRMWKTLSPAQQRTVRQVWLHVLQEVANEQQ
jgi:hypothetical protein